MTRRWREAPGLQRLAPCLLLVVVLHAAPVWLLRQDLAGVTSARVATVLTVRSLAAWTPAATAPEPAPAPKEALSDSASALATGIASLEKAPAAAIAPVAARRESSPVPPAPKAPSVVAAEGALAPLPNRESSREDVVPSPAPALPPADDYRMSGLLDPGPHALGDIEPIYPPEAGLQEGTVVMRLLIGETGEVERADVLRSYPKGLFDAAALGAFRVAKFSPGRLLGLPVKSQVTIEVAFTPLNRGSRVSGRAY
jgi:TonB family protein